MTITLRQATADDVREFSRWRYEPPYDGYDLNMDPDEAVSYFLGPDIHCHTLIEDGSVAGFCTFGQDAQVPGGDYGAEALDIGLGIRPALTGSGEGHRYVAAVIALAIGSFDSNQLRVTIATGNQRAVRVWSGAGFAEVFRFATPHVLMGSSEFAIFVRGSVMPRDP